MYLIEFLQLKQQGRYHTHVRAGCSFFPRWAALQHPVFTLAAEALSCASDPVAVSVRWLLDDHFCLLVIPHPIKYVARFGGVVCCWSVNTSAGKCLKVKEMISLLSPRGALRCCSGLSLLSGLSHLIKMVTWDHSHSTDEKIEAPNVK